MSPSDFVELRDSNHSFESVAAVTSSSQALSGDGEPEQVWVLEVSPEYFSILGTRAVIGRSLATEDQGEAYIVLSYALWTRRFGRAVDVIGKSIRLDGVNRTVVGVMPQDTEDRTQDIPWQPDCWVPLAISGDPSTRNNSYLRVIGRLKAGVTPREASADVAVISRRLSEKFPDTNGNVTMLVGPFNKAPKDLQQGAFILLVCAGLVFLIACCVCICLQIGRAIGGGAAFSSAMLTAGKLVLTGTALTLVGTVLGLCGGIFGLGLVNARLHQAMPQLSVAAISATDLTLGAGLAFVAGFVCVVLGSLPALFGRSQMTPADPSTWAPVGTAGYPGSPQPMGPSFAGSRHTVARVVRLVCLLVAIASTIALIVVSIRLRPTTRNSSTNLGFSTNNVLTMQVKLPSLKYPDASSQSAFFEQALTRIKALPGVISAAATDVLPFSGSDAQAQVHIEGRPGDPDGPSAHIALISPYYFQTMGIPLIRGRSLSEHDTASTQPVVVVSQSFAKRFFPEENPIGKRLTLGDDSTAREIVGVAGSVASDANRSDSSREFEPQVYLPSQLIPERAMYLVVRSTSNPEDLVAAVREQILSLDKDQPVFDVKTMEERVASSSSLTGLWASFFMLFAVVGAVLVSVGIGAWIFS